MLLDGDAPTPSVRTRSDTDLSTRIPVHVVWEITLSCNLKCAHCGSRAGKPRADELSTTECLDVVEQLRVLGTREINLIGGEAYLRRDWLEILAAISAGGMRSGLQTGARALSREKIAAAKAAGLNAAGVSVDGLREIHDRLRGVPGSYEQCLRVIADMAAEGIKPSANTQINRESMHAIRPLYEVLRDAGIKVWQLQLTVPCGNAADNEALILQPHEIPPLYDEIARIFEDAKRDGVHIFAGNNVGYFGPHEHLWRSLTDVPEAWSGCQAAETAIGIEADGVIKGCPSLDKYNYAGGNVRDRPIAEIWRDMADTVSRRVRPPRWGLCGTCYYGEQCGAGCTWTAGSVSEKPGNNPFCDYRARTLAKHGLRERLVRSAPAPGIPFDFASWALRVETVDGAIAEAPAQLGPPAPPRETRGELVLCPGCRQFAYEGEACPFCGDSLAEMPPPPLSVTLHSITQAIEETARINAACRDDLARLQVAAP